jgi:hypothetical protein
MLAMHPRAEQMSGPMNLQGVPASDCERPMNSRRQNRRE